MNSVTPILTSSRLPAVLSLLVLIAVGFAYLPGIPGSLYFDDHLRLNQLNNLETSEAVTTFVFGDSSGPLGRPLAMASFLPHQGHWPDQSNMILGANVMLHLLNGLLLFGVASLLARLGSMTAARANWSALLVMTLWLILPIHVSTSLIAIQRMAGLSALFVLAGLLTYLGGLQLQAAGDRRGPWVQLGGVALFTLLSALSKENGVLLPVFILILEVTLLANSSALAHLRRVRLALSGAALLAIIGYLVYHTIPLIQSQENYVGRDFNLYQRLITEPIVLLDYLRMAFIPSVVEYRPFHDDYPFYQSLASPAALFAIVLWGSLLFLLLWKRGSLPLLTFAVLWFLAAHLVESTVIGLELFFEHRNYVALIGPVYALVHGIFALPEQRRRIGLVAITVYSSFMLFMLVQVTQLWGQPAKAAEAWFLDNQRSTRAAQHLAIFYLDRGDNNTAWRILNHQAMLCEDCAQSTLQALLLSCVLGKEEATEAHHQKALQLTGTNRLTGVPSTLGNIKTHIDDGSCRLLDYRDLQGLNQGFLNHSKRSRSRDRAGLAMNLYLLSLARGEEEFAWLQRSWRLGKNPGVAIVMTRTLLSKGQPQEARRFVEKEVCERVGSASLKSIDHQSRCSTLRQLINSYEQQVQTNG